MQDIIFNLYSFILHRIYIDQTMDLTLLRYTKHEIKIKVEGNDYSL